MAEADHAILSAVESTILNREVLLAAVDRLADELSTPQSHAAIALEGELARIDEELARLTTAVADRRGELRSLLAAIRDREQRRQALVDNLAVRQNARPCSTDRATIVKELSGRLAEWRTLLQQEPSHANRLLRQVLVGKLRMTPEEHGYRFTGTGTIEPIVAGLVPHNLASPTGFEPVF